MKILTKEEALQKITVTVLGARHPYYERVTKLADKYMKLTTGEDIDSLMIQFNPREDEEQFKQRKRITKTVVSAVSSKVKVPFEKVARSNNVTKKFEFSTENSDEKMTKLVEALEGFWGEESLDDYMEQRMLDLSFSDPNSFILTEMLTIDEKVMPMPFEVSSQEAVNYHYTNNSLDFLVVSDGSNESKKYTIYCADFALVLVLKIDGSSMKEKDFNTATATLAVVLKADEISGDPDSTFVKIGKKVFSAWIVPNECGEIIAIRAGYKRDEKTLGNTYVSPMHKGIPRLEKIIKADSELDLTVALHTFPQKLQYVQRCPGIETMNQLCDNGYIRNDKEGRKCTRCKGAGVLFHTSAADALLYKMPSQDEINAGAIMPDLEKLLVYKTPDIGLIEFQDKYCRQLETMVIRDVFVSQAFEQPNSPATATEVAVNMESVYDTLYPFARKFSSVYKKIVRITACYLGLDDGLKVIHYFPKDLKLKTVDQLIAEYKAANDATLPEFFKKQIAHDIANKIWHDDDIALQKYTVKQQHMPFSGKTPEDIRDIISANRTTKELATLWVEFENIFQLLEDELWNQSSPVYFYDLPYNERVVKIDKKVKEIMLRKIQETAIGGLDVPLDDEPDPDPDPDPIE